MSLIISHNTSALNTHRNLTLSGSSMAKSIEKLSSGYKINVGADDPSGLIISEQLRSQMSGLERAVRNSSEAYNLIGIAEGALNEMNTILKKMRALAIHAANSGVTSPEQVAADQAEMDSGIETLNRIANTTRYSDQYLLNGSKQLVYDVTTVVNEPTDHALLDTTLTRVDQIFKRDGVKMSIGYTGEKNRYQANTDTSAQRAYLEADAAYSLSGVTGAHAVSRQEFILTGSKGSRMFSFAAGAHLGTIVEAINNVRDSTGIGATLTFASDVRIDQTVNGTPNGSTPDYGPPPVPAKYMTGFSDGTYVYQKGDVQIYGAGLNNPETAKIEEFCLTPDAASAFKVGYNCDGDGKIYAKVVDKSTNSIEYYKDRECTMLIGKGDSQFFAATNNSGIPSSPTQNLDGLFIKLNEHNVENQDVFEIGVVGQRLDNLKDMDVTGLPGWVDTEHSVITGVNLGVNTSPTGDIYYRYTPIQVESDGTTVKTFKVEAFSHSSCEPKYLVATSGTVTNHMNASDPGGQPILDAQGNPVLDQYGNVTYTEPQVGGQTVRLESVKMDNGHESGLTITLALPKPGVVDDEVLKNQESIRQSSVYQNLNDRLEDEANGDRSEVIQRRVVNDVKTEAGGTYITYTRAGMYQQNVDNLVSTVNTFLTSTLRNMANPSWGALESAFNTYRDGLLKQDFNYTTLRNGGYPNETDQLLKDTLAEFKDAVWVEGEFHSKEVVKDETNYAYTDFPENLEEQTNALSNDLLTAFTTAYDNYVTQNSGSTPATWADMEDLYKAEMATVRGGDAFKLLKDAGYETASEALISGVASHFGNRAPTPVYSEINAGTYIEDNFVTAEPADPDHPGLASYMSLRGQNQQDRAKTLCQGIIAQANSILVNEPDSWEEFETKLRSAATTLPLYKQLEALGQGTQLTALLDNILLDAQTDTYTPPSFNEPPTDAQLQERLGGTNGSSETYKDFQFAGDKSVQPAVDQLIENALVKYESLVKANRTTDWKDAVNQVFQQSKTYTNANQETKAILNAIALQLTDSIEAELPGYNSSITITDSMDEMMRGAYSSARTKMPEGQQVGTVSFINLGMRVYSMDYGSAESIRIQNKQGDLFYHYREADSMEKVVVKAGSTVQVAGQDAEISLNGAPVFTTGMIANTTTPDFSGTLVFNKGKLGLATMAITGYDEGKLYSKATALQGVEENEPDIIELKRHFEPPAVTVSMGVAKNSKAVPPVDAAGMLDKNGQPLNLYIDLSTLDPTVQVKIKNLTDPSAIKIDFDGTNINIDASALGGPEMQGSDLRVSIPVNPGMLATGITVENPALKGLFVRTDVMMDVNKSAGAYEVKDSPKIQAGVGNVMLEVFTYATNPRSNTDEDLSNFIGGMQFQLGNTEGDQDRTIYSIESMSMSELGRISYNGVEYCLQNVLGGGSASLSKDPILAMNILAQAVDDVSTLRARLGAFQSNMLQTNINNLGVAIENLTKTESAIRDTDMAEESTQFTRFQIMQQAGTSMLAQANQVSQNVLSLLQG